MPIGRPNRQYVAKQNRWAATGHARSSNRRLPERIRRRVLHKHPICWLGLPGICTGKSEEVHHTLEVADMDGPNDPRVREESLLVGVCKACHTRHSAQQSQKRAVNAAWDWQRKPEKHPGLLD